MVRSLLHAAKVTSIFYKTDEEIELVREACLLVCKVLAHIGEMLRPGMSGSDIDREAEELIRDHGAIPAFKDYKGFPSTLCVSVNEAVVHGIPSTVIFKDGDIVSVDCGTYLNGFYGDAAYTFPIGNVPEKVMQLCRVTKTSLYRGIEQVRHGKRIGDIGFAIQQLTEREHKYSVVRELVGHGVGKNLHEDPEVANHGKRGDGILMKEGMVIAIEPMINLGRKDVMQAQDEWTIYSKDRLPSAHYEHTVAVRKTGADVLSDHNPIETAIEQNPELRPVESLDEVLA